MRTFLVLAVAGILSWVLRSLFVTLIPSRKLSERFRSGLANAGPAAMAAMLATEIMKSSSGGTAAPLPWAAGAAVATLLAYRARNLSLTVLGGTMAYALASLFAT